MKYNKDIVSIIDKLRWSANIRQCIVEYTESYRILPENSLVYICYPYIWIFILYNFRNLPNMQDNCKNIHNKGHYTGFNLPKNY